MFVSSRATRARAFASDRLNFGGERARAGVSGRDANYRSHPVSAYISVAPPSAAARDRLYSLSSRQRYQLSLLPVLSVFQIFSSQKSLKFSKSYNNRVQSFDVAYYVRSIRIKRFGHCFLYRLPDRSPEERDPFVATRVSISPPRFV